MMDSRTQYEQWHLKEFGYAAVKIEAQQITKYFQDPVWMAWQEQDKRIAKQKEYYEMVMQDGGKRIAELEEKLKLASALKRANINNFRWHDLRHTWASWHVQNGTPLAVLKELGGWSDINMVLRYAHLSPEHLRKYANNAVA